MKSILRLIAKLILVLMVTPNAGAIDPFSIEQPGTDETPDNPVNPPPSRPSAPPSVSPTTPLLRPFGSGTTNPGTPSSLSPLMASGMENDLDRRRAVNQMQGHGHIVLSQPGGSEFGPTPFDKVGILQKWLFGDLAEEAQIKASGWAEFDYTYRSTGKGLTMVAPVMNTFGNEFLAREVGWWIQKPLDEEKLSWGFNMIFFGGSDAAFINPTRGWFQSGGEPDRHFWAQFTDLNLILHLPFLTEGGIDIKAGRQTTILGPYGALSWQRPFASSDMAWFVMEEGRFTGVTAIWHISKQLFWYNGIEIGGWGTFFGSFRDYTHNYITNLTYWLDEDAKKTKVWTTLLTGPTSPYNTGNTTVFELGFLHNWTNRFWQVVDFQTLTSYAPIFGTPIPGYKQSSYDVYTYWGYHLTREWDLNGRLDWFRDVNGLGYPGGYGIPNTHYIALTLGPNYHPNRWLQFRPEIRYDHATNPAYGAQRDKQNQLSIVANVLIEL